MPFPRGLMRSYNEARSEASEHRRSDSHAESCYE